MRLYIHDAFLLSFIVHPEYFFVEFIRNSTEILNELTKT